ncbi:MAG TPA: hypothetical protein VEC99_18990 [Clostridia bacterium]|nr:hypothetical protein [Clostridia bacterium]
MARKWSGFLPQNLNVKEEWNLLEACETRARLVETLQVLEVTEEPDDQEEEQVAIQIHQQSEQT